MTFAVAIVATTLLATGCGSKPEMTDPYPDTYDSYFASFTYDYNPATDLADLADRSGVVTRATLVDVEDGRYFGPSEGNPEGVTLNLVFETAEATLYYVQVTRPMDSSIDQLRTVLPIHSSSVLYPIPNTDPLTDGWFNARDDGNEWFFTTPQGWILDHPERGIVFPLEDDETAVPYVELPANTQALESWLVGRK